MRAKVKRPSYGMLGYSWKGPRGPPYCANAVAASATVKTAVRRMRRWGTRHRTSIRCGHDNRMVCGDARARGPVVVAAARVAQGLRCLERPTKLGQLGFVHIGYGPERHPKM